MIILLTTRIIPCYVVLSLFDTKGIHLKQLFTVFQGLLISASVSTDERATGEGQNCNVLDDTKGSLGRVSHFPCAVTSMFGMHSSLVVCIEKVKVTNGTIIMVHLPLPGTLGTTGQSRRSVGGDLEGHRGKSSLS